MTSIKINDPKYPVQPFSEAISGDVFKIVNEKGETRGFGTHIKVSENSAYSYQARCVLPVKGTEHIVIAKSIEINY